MADIKPIDISLFEHRIRITLFSALLNGPPKIVPPIYIIPTDPDVLS